MMSKDSLLITSSAIGLTAAVTYLYTTWRASRHITAIKSECSEEIARVTRIRDDERMGRTNVERVLRMQLQSNDQACTRVIAYVDSCWRDRRGTPRQGTVVTLSRGIVQMEPFTQPQLTLDGLQDYSHLWLIWQFHENTNLVKSSLAKSNQLGVHAKVHPPRLGGNTTGLFATRTPHRPNPIGISLVKIDNIDIESGKIFISGLDLVSGTPIFDIKPYIPACDSVNLEEVKVPEWVSNRLCDYGDVIIPDSAKESINSIINNGSMQFYSSLEEVCEVIRDVLKFDIRSRFRKRTDETTRFTFRLDGISIEYFVDKDAIHIANINPL